MSMNFETTLNNRTFRGTVNVNDMQIYKKDGTKYSPSYQKRLQNTREYFIIMTIIKGRQTKKEHQKEQNIYDFFTIFNDGIDDPEINI